MNLFLRLIVFGIIWNLNYICCNFIINKMWLWRCSPWFLQSAPGSWAPTKVPWFLLFSLSLSVVVWFALRGRLPHQWEKNISVISHERFVFESSKYISSQSLLLTLHRHHHLHLSFIFLFLSPSQQESCTQPPFKNSSLSLQSTGKTTTLPAVLGVTW